MFQRRLLQLFIRERGPRVVVLQYCIEPVNCTTDSQHHPNNICRSTPLYGNLIIRSQPEHTATCEKKEYLGSPHMQPKHPRLQKTRGINQQRLCDLNCVKTTNQAHGPDP
jgi:hypothetical protein